MNNSKRLTNKTYFIMLSIFIYIGIFLIVDLNVEQSEKIKTPKNGDLDHTFRKSKGQTNTIDRLKQKKDSLFEAGWDERYMYNGQLSDCYNFKPIRSKIDNYLDVTVGGGTDAVIKIMDIKTDKCIRYVFIGSGTDYRITNIPEGKYYLKIAYGKNWFSKTGNGKCIGKFISNPLYEKGEDILDYNIQRTAKGQSIPSYSLKLDVVSSNSFNSFDSYNISEKAFNE